jgi:multidrug efflux pump subunit AcrA (membrane-fusion protein)
MPVGIAGEGGMVSNVLVQPGQWVRAGQTLAVIDRSVQGQEAQRLAAQVEVARADARLAQQELDRAQALVRAASSRRPMWIAGPPLAMRRMRACASPRRSSAKLARASKARYPRSRCRSRSPAQCRAGDRW